MFYTVDFSGENYIAILVQNNYNCCFQIDFMLSGLSYQQLFQVGIVVKSLLQATQILKSLIILWNAPSNDLHGREELKILIFIVQEYHTLWLWQQPGGLSLGQSSEVRIGLQRSMLMILAVKAAALNAQWWQQQWYCHLASSTPTLCLDTVLRQATQISSPTLLMNLLAIKQPLTNFLFV